MQLEAEITAQIIVWLKDDHRSGPGGPGTVAENYTGTLSSQTWSWTHGDEQDHIATKTLCYMIYDAG